MTERAPDADMTRTSLRRTVALLLAWLAAAVVAGVPAGAGQHGERRAACQEGPVVVNTGPECFAGHAAAPAPAKGRELGRGRREPNAGL